MVRQQEQFSLTCQRHSIPSVIPFYKVNCPVTAYMIWNYNRLLIIYFFVNRSFNLMVSFQNQVQLTLEFLKEVFLGLSFFSFFLTMCIVPFVIVR